jgi:DNA-binding NarL/FixJ family response regulator
MNPGSTTLSGNTLTEREKGRIAVPDVMVGTVRVLVVDDYDLLAQSLCRALDAEDDLSVVGVAASVRTAVDLALEVSPDVVIMDYQLPDGTGADATAMIKAELPDTHIVMLTGLASGATLAEALEAGCAGFVTKEGRFSELIDAIRAVLRGEVRVPQSLIEDLAAHLRPRSPGLGADLTRREREVLALLAAGASTNHMVETLFVSVHTVRNHIRSILSKLHARSRLEAVAIATRLGLLSLSPDEAIAHG